MLELDPRELEILLEVLTFEYVTTLQSIEDDDEDKTEMLTYTSELRALIKKIRGE